MQTYLDPFLNLSSEQYTTLVAGVALLILGRRLYWLAVGCLGAGLAVGLAAQLGQSLDPQLRWLIIAVAALAGALFALAAQKMALVFAGVVLGALACGFGTFVLLEDVMSRDPDGWPLLAALLGAFLGLIFARAVFNGALILVSAAVGAGLLTTVLSAAWLLTPLQEAISVAVLFAVGLMAQAGRKKRPPRHDE